MYELSNRNQDTRKILTERKDTHREKCRKPGRKFYIPYIYYGLSFILLLLLPCPIWSHVMKPYNFIVKCYKCYMYVNVCDASEPRLYSYMGEERKIYVYTESRSYEEILFVLLPFFLSYAKRGKLRTRTLFMPFPFHWVWYTNLIDLYIYIIRWEGRGHHKAIMFISSLLPVTLLPDCVR